MTLRSTPPPAGLTGKRVGVTAERRTEQQVRFLTTRGAEVEQAAVLRTVDHAERPSIVTAGLAMIDQPPDLLVVQTGQGFRWWLAAIGDELTPKLIEALATTEIWCRGIKATSACRGVGLDVAWQSPSESTADVVAKLSRTDLSGWRVAIQMDGNADRNIVTAASGAENVTTLDVYKYRLPDDLSSSRSLIAKVVSGEIDAVTFTASPAIRHLREIAARCGMAPALDQAFRSTCLAAVVGPVCAATARDAGWTNLIEPERARLVPMLEALEAALTP